ncbi:hypothetical protein PAAG_06315 [Paracoccidioides lutzii Pb01]|uniref:Zn(2)-C6 fungal-type domain-containing protein n=1 Tax=Paracoccidioides lutzii (strain ATCC MYA-826 / Pb01) TaxID=502779 RepID=C1H6C4_PARBA|nr:hypothetical protein PAAG_06315 [Paracoccidioides lutzii Pb01]EEH35268.1 hypothetical protein PAAG_06315 [Paracoccidioides lutzii Pb01]
MDDDWQNHHLSFSTDEKLRHHSPESSSTLQEPSPKRSAEAAEFDGPDGKVNRKRSAKACQSCRSRKVRCSVSDHGVPCYNCKLDDVKCIVPERKRPTRTTKRQRFIGAVISAAVVRMGRASPDSGNSSPGSVPETSHGDWDKGFQRTPDTNIFLLSSPNSSQQNATEENSEIADNARPMSDLPPCDDELARWFSVMPPRVVDKMFSYLQSVSQNGILEPYGESDSSHSDSTMHLLPSGSKRKKRYGTISRRKPVRNCVASRPPEYPPQVVRLPTRESPPREWPLSSTQEPNKGRPVIQQLRDDNAATCSKEKDLEEAIQKSDSQLTKKQTRQTGGKHSLDTCRESSSDLITKATSVLIPPPEHYCALAMSMQAFQQLEALHTSTHRGPYPNQPTTKEGTQEETLVTGNGGLGCEFQSNFDSMINFWAGDAFDVSTFQL